MLCAFSLLLASLQASIPVTFEFRLSGVDPDQFANLGGVISSILGITEEIPKLIDYELATPTNEPTPSPSPSPTDNPTQGPTETPTQAPSQTPTATPTMELTTRRRQLSLSDLYSLVYIIYVDDKAAADALITSVEDLDDPETALLDAIASELNLDPADITVRSVAIEYKDGVPPQGGNKNSVTAWVVSIVIVFLIIAVVFIITYGPYYEHTEVFLFDEDTSEFSSSELDDEESTTPPLIGAHLKVK